MKIKNGFELRKVGDEYVVITIGKGLDSFNGMIKLNRSGVFLWEHMKINIEIDALIEAFSKEFSIDMTIAKRDVNAFIESIKRTNCFE